MKRTLRWFDAITINIYWLGITTLSQTNGLVMPLLVQQFVGEEAKGTYYGKLRLWTLMVALLAQALMGMISDRSRISWGRRRPFILAGTIANLVFITAVGFTAGLEGMGGFWLLFGIGILQMISANTGHAAVQGFIPDLVPTEQRGRFSAIKAVLEIPLPTILVAFTVGRLVAAGNTWAGLIVAMVVMLVTMLLAMLVREEPPPPTAPALDWQPFLRLVLMTGVFTAIILGLGQGVGLLGRLVEGSDSAAVLLGVMGVAGLIAMAVAVGLGVWLSVRIGVGQDARRNPSFTWWVINRLAFLVGVNNLSTFAVYFVQGRLGYAQEEAAGPASQLMMIVGVTILLFALPSGWLADRFGRKRLVALSGIVAALGTLILLLTTNMAIIYVGGCLIGAATGVFFTANWALGTDLVPKEEAGRYLGLSNLAGAGAGAVGAYIGGPIADLIGARLPDTAGIGYVLLFAIYGLLFVGSVLALSRVQEAT